MVRTLILIQPGTTGRPKGVAISHTSLIIQSLAKIAIVGYGEDDVRTVSGPQQALSHTVSMPC
jgi:o-succinylbenzoate---CoA ligase